ncbi:S8 family peptidase [Lachnospiraceae bacterium MD335]|nr:hypothetical protein C809_00583 [Lachnospiraceae bacterium MD335]NDO48396.1 S8 family peptidase [Lachnospiraceae bacterium MD335]
MTCRERILSNEYADLVVNFVLPDEYEYERPVDYCNHIINEDLQLFYIKRSDLPDLRFSKASYSFIPKCYGLVQVDQQERGVDLNTLSLADVGILSVQRPPLNLTGKNVTIGFIDTGIRYQDEVFRDMAGNSRILAIWDQTIQTGKLPDGFEYGSEYTQEDINAALQSDDPFSIVPSTDANGHGSELAAVAAGSPIANGNFIGAAPDARIVMVKLKEIKPYLREYYKIPEGVPCYSETDILQALQYLQKFSQVLYTPLVICFGLGTSLGDHAGSGTLATYLNTLSYKKSQVIVTPAGNEGNTSHHFHAEMSMREAYKDVQLRVGEDERGFVMDLWGEAPYYYNVTVRTPGGEGIRWSNPRSPQPQEFTFVFEKTRIIIEYFWVEHTSGAELIRFRFIEPTAGVWNIRVNSAGNVAGGCFDIWLPISQFLSSDTYFLEASPQTTITEPAYAEGTITVSNYQSSNVSIAPSSGRGFGKNGMIVPDIAAPGVNVSTPFGPGNGTSISAAITAGGCAQLLEWAVVNQNDLFVNSTAIKNYLIRGADREDYLEYPNREWGYGSLNIAGVFEFLAELG